MLLLVAAVSVVLVGAGLHTPARAVEQTVEVLNHESEAQRLEPITPPVGEQQLQMIDPGAAQQTLSSAEMSPGEKVASGIAKGVVGVVSVVVSVAAMAATLMFI